MTKRIFAVILGVLLGIFAAGLVRSSYAGSSSEKHPIVLSDAHASTGATAVTLWAAASGHQTVISGLTVYNTDTIVHTVTISSKPATGSSTVIRAFPVPSATSTTDYGSKTFTELDNLASNVGESIVMTVDTAGVTTSCHASGSAFQDH